MKDKILYIGVGDAGCNIVSKIENRQILKENIELVAINSDFKSLSNIKNIKTIQVGSKLTKGLGSEMQPEIAKKAVLEKYDEIKSLFSEVKLVVIIAGFGRGTGTGASLVIAQIAKEMGAISISVITKPFLFEGRKANKIADDDINNIKKVSNSILIINNDKLLIDKTLGIKDAFKEVDKIVILAIDSIDLKNIANYKGVVNIDMGKDFGENINVKFDMITSLNKYAVINNIDYNV